MCISQNCRQFTEEIVLFFVHLSRIFQCFSSSGFQLIFQQSSNKWFLKRKTASFARLFRASGPSDQSSLDYPDNFFQTKNYLERYRPPPLPHPSFTNQPGPHLLWNDRESGNPLPPSYTLFFKAAVRSLFLIDKQAFFISVCIAFLSEVSNLNSVYYRSTLLRFPSHFCSHCQKYNAVWIVFVDFVGKAC